MPYLPARGPGSAIRQQPGSNSHLPYLPYLLDQISVIVDETIGNLTFWEVLANGM